MLSEEQITQIKSQIVEHINSTFPEDKKEMAIQQIQAMNSEELEEFLNQNNLIKDSDNNETPKVFRMIVEGKIPSHKIDENNSAIAVLEINPLSRAHTLIIPKKPVEKPEDFKKQHFELAEEIKQKIIGVFSPKDIQISSKKLFGEEIINIIPIYENKELKQNSERANEKELQEIKQQLDKIQTKPEKTKKSKTEECLFCSIYSGKIPSYKISENNSATTILEINPISTGHSITIPKKHLSQQQSVPGSVFGLAKKTGKKIKSKLKAKEIKFRFSQIFGHTIVEILPVYDKEMFDSEKKPASKKELEEIQKTLKTENKTKIKKSSKNTNQKNKKDSIKTLPWIPKRIP